MNHLIYGKEQMMGNFGLFGTITTFIGYSILKIWKIVTYFTFQIAPAFVWSTQIEILQLVIMYLTAITGTLTIFWYIGNMIIKWDELKKSRLWKAIWRKK